MSLLHIWLLTAFSLGLDSFLAGLAIGPLLPSRTGRLWCAAAFGVCDGLASWLGALIPHRLPEPPDLALWLVCVMLLLAGARRGRMWLFAVPVVLSLDNLAAGVPADLAPALALSSAVMAAAGIALGRLARISANWRREAV